jgi:hypothetical protein
MTITYDVSHPIEECNVIYLLLMADQKLSAILIPGRKRRKFLPTSTNAGGAEQVESPHMTERLPLGHNCLERSINMGHGL